jgi:CheY-like chemotaxis protein
MSSADPSAGAGRRVLIVEDEYLVAEYIAEMLADLGYEIVGPVATVPEAIASIAHDKLDGAPSRRKPRGTSSAPIAAELAERGLPFIVVTGYGSFALDTAALRSAPRINKPFTAADLARSCPRQ